jgi:hypothetical protein
MACGLNPPGLTYWPCHPAVNLAGKADFAPDFLAFFAPFNASGAPQTWWRSAFLIPFIFQGHTSGAPQTWWRFSADLVALAPLRSADLVALLRRLGGASPQTWWRCTLLYRTYRTLQNTLSEHFSELQNRGFSKKPFRKGCPEKPANRCLLRLQRSIRRWPQA